MTTIPDQSRQSAPERRAFHAEMLEGDGDPGHRDCAAHSAETLADLLPDEEEGR